MIPTPALARLLSPGMIALAVATFCFALYYRALGAGGGTMGSLDLMLDTLVNFQFVVAVLVPAWSLVQLVAGRPSMFRLVAIRSGSHRRIWWSWLRGSIGTLLAAVVALLAAIGIASLGLPLLSIGGPGSVAGFLVTSGGLPPLVAAIAQLVIVLTTFTAIAAAHSCLWIAHAPRIVGAAIAAITWLWFLISSLEVIPITSAWNAVRLVDLRLVLLTPQPSATAGAALAAVVAGCWWFVRRLDGRAAGHGFRRPSVTGGLLVGGCAVVLFAFARPEVAAQPFSAAFRTAFWGAGGSLWQYLTMLALWAAFVFGRQLRQGEAVGELLLLEQIRRGSPFRWARHSALTMCFASLGYVIGVVVLALVGYLLAGGSDFATEGESALADIVRFVGSGVLTLTSGLLIAAAAERVWASPLAGIGALCALATLSVLVYTVGEWGLGTPWSLYSRESGPEGIVGRWVLPGIIAMLAFIRLAAASTSKSSKGQP